MGEPTEDYVYTDNFRPDIYRLVPPDGKVIGSIGCGYAPTEARLNAEGREVHGVDVSPEAIAVAKTRLTSARVVIPDGSLPFDENSLDGLILADVLEHIPAAWVALQDFTKMVKPGGWVAISVPNMRYITALGTFVLGGDWPEDELGLFDRTHIQVTTHKRLDRWARAAGLVPEERFESRDWRAFWRKAHRAINILTFYKFRNFFEVEIQVRYRKPKAA